MGAARSPAAGAAVTLIIVNVVLLTLWMLSVVYRAKLMASGWRVPTYCHDVRRCRRKHRLVFIQPPHKPARAVLKHVA